ncbi:hypothetical protein NP493_159g00035 [Ridgeia piscesae]|uniref:EGF-like domain-containing protein n=1 Tax=Ridgeia piscesae TaxID=27915 RepID=A0AAD9UFK4_RIDPI|nr:hypothetical protein NP493_159g00035 [Ridgeia piscesae]
MAAFLKQTVLVAALTVAYVRLATTDLVPLTGDHVCVSKTCTAVEKNESYVGCAGCPPDQEPPVDNSTTDCRELPTSTTAVPLPSPASPKCPTSRTQTCYRTVVRYEERSANVKHCCPGYVEKEEGKCIWHHPLHHLACQVTGARLRHFRPSWRCGAHARCVVKSCICDRGYTADSAGFHCIDIDECVTQHPCEHYCNNTDGGYICQCRPSHDLHSNGHNCTAKTLTNPGPAKTQTSTTTVPAAISTTSPPSTPRTSIEGPQRAVHLEDASTSTSLVAGLAAGAALVVVVAAAALYYQRRRAFQRRPAGGDTEHSAYLPPGGATAIIVPPQHDGHLAFENHLYQDLPPHGNTDA